MKAEVVYEISSGPAPKEWEEISEIKKHRPSPIGHEVILQRFDGTNLCSWYTRSKVYWNPASDIFLVKD